MTSAHAIHPPSTRRLLIVALVALLSVGALLSSSLASTVRAADRPTVVLVHGAWASPPGWAMTVERLERAGYETIAPQLSLLGLAEDVAILRGALDAISGDKLLVAHSWGGFVAANVAYGRGDVRGIVYTAAFVPDEGDSILSLGVGFPESAVLHHLEWLGEPFASLAYIIRDDFHEVMASDLNPKLAQQLNDGQLPTSPAILVTPSGPTASDLPTWYAISGIDVVIPPSLQLSMANQAGSTIVEFPDASHVGGYTHYVSRFVKLIVEAAEATAP